jgi:hypothetical protein
MKCLVIVLLSVMWLVSPVSAGCAWILWQDKQENEIIGPGQWRSIGQWYLPWGSYQTLSDCQKSLGPLRSADTTTLPNGNQLINNYICLPDTVDPRSPKGK